MIAMSVQNISMVLHILRQEADVGVVAELSHGPLSATEQVAELALFPLRVVDYFHPTR